MGHYQLDCKSIFLTEKSTDTDNVTDIRRMISLNRLYCNNLFCHPITYMEFPYLKVMLLFQVQ